MTKSTPTRRAHFGRRIAKSGHHTAYADGEGAAIVAGATAMLVVGDPHPKAMKLADPDATLSAVKTERIAVPDGREDRIRLKWAPLLQAEPRWAVSAPSPLFGFLKAVKRVPEVTHVRFGNECRDLVIEAIQYAGSDENPTTSEAVARARFTCLEGEGGTGEAIVVPLGDMIAAAEAVGDGARIEMVSIPSGAARLPLLRIVGDGVTTVLTGNGKPGQVGEDEVVPCSPPGYCTGEYDKTPVGGLPPDAWPAGPGDWDLQTLAGRAVAVHRGWTPRPFERDELYKAGFASTPGEAEDAIELIRLGGNPRVRVPAIILAELQDSDRSVDEAQAKARQMSKASAKANRRVRSATRKLQKAAGIAQRAEERLRKAQKNVDTKQKRFEEKREQVAEKRKRLEEKSTKSNLNALKRAEQALASRHRSLLKAERRFDKAREHARAARENHVEAEDALRQAKAKAEEATL